jgi:hypothetical protein
VFVLMVTQIQGVRGGEGVGDPATAETEKKVVAELGVVRVVAPGDGLASATFSVKVRVRGLEGFIGGGCRGGRGGGGRGVEGVEEDSDEGRKLRWRKKKGGA